MTTTVFRCKNNEIAYNYAEQMWIHPISGQFVHDLDMCLSGWSEMDKYEQIAWDKLVGKIKELIVADAFWLENGGVVIL